MRRLGPPLPLTKSFAQVVMNRERGERKRGAEEGWMEEDDLLGFEAREGDLRNKL